MIMGYKVIQFARCFDYIINSWITEFNNFSCLNINQVIVLAALIRSFELSDIPAELMFDYKVTFKKKFDSVI